MILLFILAIIATILYKIGGEKWAHTLFRDIGVPSCVVIGLGNAVLWHWSLIVVFLVMWAGLSVGDYGKFHWTIHAFFVALSLVIYANFTSWLAFSICLLAIPIITYVWSRFIKIGDVYQRGLTFGAIPIIFKILG